MIVYICFFVIIIVSYIVWRYFLDTLIWLVKLCFSKEQLLGFVD